MQTNLKASVIISTYNNPEWLSLILYSYELQTNLDFEIIIADDGSDERTKSIIGEFLQTSRLNVIHVWQKDDGFQKTKILNKAIVASNSNYLIFTDGDCIARKDFVETHLKLKRFNCALSGGYFKLAEAITSLITKEVVENESCFKKEWLIKNGQQKSFKFNKLTISKLKAVILNKITTTNATFDGMNVSCYKADIVKVNGFDERMQYGGLDREVGERMMNNGVEFLQIRYSAICVHLHHDRPYNNPEVLQINNKIRQETRRTKSTYTSYGIRKA
jgi:glycosyltransferase involved in cell wall biosynthesis